MAFIEQRLNNGLIMLDTTVDVSFSTEVVEFGNGARQRNAEWDQALGRWELGDRNVGRPEFLALRAWFQAAKGKANGFRMRDPAEWAVAQEDGRLGLDGVGTGEPGYQLTRAYAVGALVTVRDILKPVAGTVTVYRNGAPATAGAAAGQYALDTTTGRVTWVADQSASVVAVTVGVSTVVTLSAGIGLAIGKRLYLAGLGGADAALLNGTAHEITGLTGNVYTLATNTTAAAITAAGSGYRYPQDAETLAWSGEFDIPAAFDTDTFRAEFLAHESDELQVWRIDPLPVIEDRRP